MKLTENRSAINVMITPKTVQASARSADRFQVIVFPSYSMISFVRTSATMAGIVKASVPENRRVENGKNTQARTPTPSIRKPRMMIRKSERFHEGAVKIYLVS
jgi:hypothetical protein